MGVPKCARCNHPSYGGEIRILVAEEEKTYSLCGYCLPIVSARIHFVIESNLLPDNVNEFMENRIITSKG